MGGGQGMAFGEEECETTQVTIPKDVSFKISYFLSLSESFEEVKTFVLLLKSVAYPC